MLARPSIKAPQILAIRHASRKRRINSLRTDLRQFLGPRNFKGLYTKNPFFWAAKDHNPKYITSVSTTGAGVRTSGRLDWRKVFARNEPIFDRSPDAALRPFPENEFTKSAVLVPMDLQRSIVKALQSGRTTAQQLAFKHGISIPRINAICTLHRIEHDMTKQNLITPEMKKLNATIQAMMPIMSHYKRESVREDMTEIPIPQETRHQRFLTVAESEPFGPVDAARVLGIESAAETLEKLNSPGEQAETGTSTSSNVAFTAPQLDGEKAVFHFTNAKVGQVGFRYGASRDDRRHARKVRYDQTGRMVYQYP